MLGTILRYHIPNNVRDASALPVTKPDARAPGLTRRRVVDAAIELMEREGLDALTMRALGEALRVKAASLYWHVRDREELLQLIAGALLDAVPMPPPGRGWREEVLAICAAMDASLTRRRDAARVLLAVPGALEQSPPQRALVATLSRAGLPAAEASATAAMMLTAVLAGMQRPRPESGAQASPVRLAIDTGSRGVVVRAGAGMVELIRAGHDPEAAAPAIVRGDTIVVRRLRGGRQGLLELNPATPWRFKVQAPTWNTVLDMSGLDVRELHVDSGAVRVECVLPPPRGVVPVDISSGVVGVRLRRPPGVAVVADLSAGSVKLRLDGHAISAAAPQTHWESAPGAAARDHYRLRVASGTVRVTLEEDPAIVAPPAPAPAPPPASVVAALHVVLDGVAARTR